MSADAKNNDSNSETTTSNVKELETILSKTQLNKFELSNSKDVHTIYEKSKKLNLNEKAQLLTCFKTSYSGTLLFDPAGILDVKIWIDDGHSEVSRDYPLAYIEHTDYYRSHIEIINILESVRNDATIIGHPVIIAAIQYWQKILIWEAYITDENVYTSSEIGEKLSWHFSGRQIERAKQNLKLLGNALLEGSRRQAIPKERAFVQQIEELGLEGKNNFLFIAWKRLSSKYIEKFPELDERIQAIEDYLRSLNTDEYLKQLNKKNHINADSSHGGDKYLFINSVVGIPMVIDFLKNSENKFVGTESIIKNGEEIIRSKKPQWRVFLNAFLAWYSTKKNETVEKYKRIAKQQKLEEEPFFPTLLALPSHQTSSLLNDVFNKKLHEYCKPIDCFAGFVNTAEFFKLIDQRRTK